MEKIFGSPDEVQLKAKMRRIFRFDKRLLDELGEDFDSPTGKHGKLLD